MNWTADDIELVDECARRRINTRWDDLALRIWATHQEAAAALDGVVEFWGDWVAAFPCEEPFDWMVWRPWKFMRSTLVWPNPPLPQYPRVDGLYTPANGAIIFDFEPRDRSGYLGPCTDLSRGVLVDFAGIGDGVDYLMTPEITPGFQPEGRITDAIESGQGPDGTLID